jgi:hypothetical protein
MCLYYIGFIDIYCNLKPAGLNSYLISVKIDMCTARVESTPLPGKPRKVCG